MKIYDSFLFYNELELLEIRLHELYPAVDKFIVVEGDLTFSGKPKDLEFKKNADLFSKYADKIEYVCVSDWPNTDDPWIREFHQRNALTNGSECLSDDDFVIFSDVDEIPSREKVLSLRGSPYRSVAFQQQFSYFAFDYLHGPSALCSQCWSIAERRGTIRNQSVQSLRESRGSRVDAFERGATATEAGIDVLFDAGWHLSYCGTNDFVRNKIQNFSHQEFNKPDILESISIREIMKNERDLFGRSHEKWFLAQVPISLPHLVREHPDRFLHLFYNPDILFKSLS